MKQYGSTKCMHVKSRYAQMQDRQIHEVALGWRMSNAMRGLRVETESIGAASVDT